MKRTLLIVLLLVILGGVFLFVVVPTGIIASEGGFRARQVFVERSSDGQLEVSVAKRVSFPAYDWVDPSVIIVFQLREVSTGKVLDSVRSSLVEDSDFTTPVVHWHSVGADVTAFDSRLKQSASLRAAPIKTLHATAVGVAVERRSVRSIILFPSDAGAHPAVRELFRWTH